MSMETPQPSHQAELSLGSVPGAQQFSSAGNGVADNPHEPEPSPDTTTATTTTGATNQDPAQPRPTPNRHASPQNPLTLSLNLSTPTSATHHHQPEKSDSAKQHKRSNSSARPTPSRNTPTSGGIPTELIPAELRGDFAPGVWEPANQKRRAHSRNVSLALPSSPSSDDDSAARQHRRKSSQPVAGRKRSAPAPDAHQSAAPTPPQHTPQTHHHHQRDDSSAPRKRTTAQHAHHSSQHHLQHHTPARLHQHTQSLPNIDTSASNRHRRTATLTSQPPSTPYTATMVGLSDKKRVKGVKITRAFRIGSEAWKLDEKNRPAGIPEDHTTGWRVYVENVDGGPDISTWLNKVQFSLHETYPNNKRMIANPPFEVRETGWGGFTVEIRLYFQPYVGEKHAVRSHYLYLEPYGPPESAERQRAANLVKAEILDFVEFNEPTEVLYAALTDEERQWPVESSGRGSGKGKGAAAAAAAAAAQRKAAGQEERSVELPERATERNPYAKQMEESFIRLFRQAGVDVDKQIEELTRKKEVLDARRKELIESGDLDVGKKKK